MPMVLNLFLVLLFHDKIQSQLIVIQQAQAYNPPFSNQDTSCKDEPERLAIQSQDSVSSAQNVWPYGDITRGICSHDLY